MNWAVHRHRQQVAHLRRALRQVRSGRCIAASLVVLALALSSAGCSDSASTGTRTVTIVAYSSFPTAGTPLNDQLDAFTASTGIKVNVVTAGDTGEMVSKAVLTAGNPEGDIMFGIDSFSMTRAIKADVFQRYESPTARDLPKEFTDLEPTGNLTPVDHSEICLNYDIKYFHDHQIDPPRSLDDLVKPQYKSMSVVENPSSSSPGLGFLLATIARFGDEWPTYWKGLRRNDVQIVDSWETAYNDSFSRSDPNGRPIVVSYATSPPYEVLYADPPSNLALTAIVPDSCLRVVEFAGVLRGTRHQAEAEKLLDFLIGVQFQSSMPLTLFVYPIRTDVTLPPEFTNYVDLPSTLLEVKPSDIESSLQKWLEEWMNVAVR